MPIEADELPWIVVMVQYLAPLCKVVHSRCNEIFVLFLIHFRKRQRLQKLVERRRTHHCALISCRFALTKFPGIYDSGIHPVLEIAICYIRVRDAFSP